MVNDMRLRELSAVLLFCLPLSVSAQIPVGGLFQVNTSTEGSQQWPALAMAPGGAFVVTWEDVIIEPPVLHWEINGRLFAPDGGPVAKNFQVNTYEPDIQESPSVAMAPDGSFVVVWNDSRNQSGDYGGVFGQRLDADGDPIGGDFHVNLNAATETRPAPEVAMWDDGSFVVVWSGFGLGDDLGILGLRFDSAGSSIGLEFQVNTFTTYQQSSPAVTTIPGGGFVVAWTSAYQDGGADGISGRRFGADATPIGAEFKVNSYTPGRQREADVAATAAGDFVVVWNSYDGQDGSDSGVFGQSFAADGTSRGHAFMVNSSTVGNQLRPKIATLSGDRFVVVWQDVSEPVGRLLSRGGIPAGDEFPVTAYVTGHQQNARVAAAGSEFVVVWGSVGQDGDSGGIFGQRFLDDVVIFADGFESGDTSRWSE